MSIDFRWKDSTILGVYHDDVHIADMSCTGCTTFTDSKEFLNCSDLEKIFKESLKMAEQTFIETSESYSLK